MSRTLLVAASAVLLAACQTAGSSPPDSAMAPARETSGPSAFAEGACGGCHALGRGALSPNPAAPTFVAIANRDGLTRETLRAFLIDAHNYPEDMEFYLDEAEADALAAYIVTLRE